LNGDCSGNIQFLMDGGQAPYSFSWSDFSSNTSSSAYDLCAGTYDVTVTDANGCELVISEEVGGTTGLTSQISKDKSIRLYPNPAEDKLTVRSQHEIQEIEIMSITGRKMNMYNTILSGNTKELNISHLSAGTYIVKLKVNDLWTNVKLVVK